MAREGAPSRRKFETSKAEDARRYSTSAIKPPMLTIEIGGRDYEVDSDIDIDLMEQMLAIEEIVKDKDSDDEEYTTAVYAGRDLVRALLEESNKNVPKRIPLKVGGLLGIFAFILHGRSVAEEVQRTLAEADFWAGEQEGEDGKPVGPQPESPVAEDAEAAPLEKPSGRRSSRSAKPAAGRSTGGEESPGESSSSTSAKRKAAAA